MHCSVPVYRTDLAHPTIAATPTIMWVCFHCLGHVTVMWCVYAECNVGESGEHVLLPAGDVPPGIPGTHVWLI